MKRTTAVILALLLGLPAIGEAEKPNPGPDTYLFRASIPDNGMVVFLPESEIESKEDAAAYLDWARKTYPVQASRLRAVWASEKVDLPAAWPAEAALLKEEDSAVDSSGSIAFKVAEPLKNGKFKLRLANRPAKGEASPHLCLTNVWVLPREQLLERWKNDLETRPDEGRVEVKAQIEALRSSGRFNLSGGEAWRTAIEDFRTNYPALWPRVRFENRTGVPVEIRYQFETNTISPGDTWSVAVKEPPADGSVNWLARAASDPALLPTDYEWSSNSIPWSHSASSDPMHFFETPPGTVKPMPTLQLKLSVDKQKPSVPFPMLAGLRATVYYKDGNPETIQAFETNGCPCVEVRPHAPTTGISLEADGYEPSIKVIWEGCDELALNCGDTMAIPFPKMLVPVKKEEEKVQEKAVVASSPSEQPEKKEPPAPAAPAIQTYPIAPWPGTEKTKEIPLWPWPSAKNQKSKMRAWWDFFGPLESARLDKTDLDRDISLDFYHNLLIHDETFQKAYLHIASCHGCNYCRVHRGMMAKYEGFGSQRWVMFYSLLTNSDVDWSAFTYPPTAERINKLSELLAKTSKEKIK